MTVPWHAFGSQMHSGKMAGSGRIDKCECKRLRDDLDVANATARTLAAKVDEAKAELRLKDQLIEQLQHQVAELKQDRRGWGGNVAGGMREVGGAHRLAMSECNVGRGPPPGAADKATLSAVITQAR